MTLFITPNGRIIRSTARAEHAAPAAQANTRQQVEYDVVVPLDVKTEENDYVITALLPGMKADDLSIQVHNETLTIQGEMKNAAAEDVKFCASCPLAAFTAPSACRKSSTQPAPSPT